MTDIIRDFLFADDCALNAVSEANMHCKVDKFSAQPSASPSAQRRLTCYTNQPAPGKPYAETNITVNGQGLNAVNRFTYLGSTLSQNATTHDEVNVELAKLAQPSTNHKVMPTSGTEGALVCRRSSRYTGQ